MTSSRWRYLLGFFIIMIMMCTMVHAAYTLKTINASLSARFYQRCHPSYDEFVISTLAADFTSDRTEGDAPLRYIYDVSHGFADARLWDFGDGNTSTEKTLFTRIVSGKYDVSLTLYSNYTYETPMEEYLNTSRGQMTDFAWEALTACWIT